MARNILSKALSAALGAVLVCTLIPAVALAQTDNTGQWSEDGPYTFTKEQATEKLRNSETLQPLSFDAYGNVALSSGNHEKWIDRIDITSTAKAFYETLEEAADNDGYNDYLIENKYFNGSARGSMSAGSYYYDGSAVIIYGAIPFSSTSDCSNKVNEAYEYMLAVYAAFDRDHPEVFWLGESFLAGSHIVTNYGGRGTAYPYFVLKANGEDVRSSTYRSETTIKSQISVNETNAKAAINDSGANSVSSASEKVVAINDWLTANNAYNSQVAIGNSSFTSSAHPDVWTCTSALAGRTGAEGPVCEGYARAFMVLCDKLGIPCVLVDGYAKSSPYSSGEGHMWNYVKVDGAWYAVDVTWNDPYSRTNPSNAVSGSENHDWLLLGSETTVASVYYYSMTFIESHEAENCVYSDGTCFTNGPVLSAEAYGLGASAVNSEEEPSEGQDTSDVTGGNDSNTGDATDSDVSSENPGDANTDDSSDVQDDVVPDEPAEGSSSEESGDNSGDQTYTPPIESKVPTQVMYRLYNPNSGEHFYTASTNEKNMLIGVGWSYEGIGWTAPTSGDPVYRLYNPNSGEHHYTTSAGERNSLVYAGWKYENIGWYSDPNMGSPVYRLYNPNEYANNHHYTTNASERNLLISFGWLSEDVAWYAASAS